MCRVRARCDGPRVRFALRAGRPARAERAGRGPEAARRRAPWASAAPLRAREKKRAQQPPRQPPPPPRRQRLRRRHARSYLARPGGIAPPCGGVREHGRRARGGGGYGGGGGRKGRGWGGDSGRRCRGAIGKKKNARPGSGAEARHGAARRGGPPHQPHLVPRLCDRGLVLGRVLRRAVLAAGDAHERLRVLTPPLRALAPPHAMLRSFCFCARCSPSRRMSAAVRSAPRGASSSRPSTGTATATRSTSSGEVVAGVAVILGAGDAAVVLRSSTRCRSAVRPTAARACVRCA